MNIVVVDAANLAGEVDFPMLDLPKYGWLQFPALSGSELAERCWRADVIVTVNTPIDREVLNQSYKVALIVAAGDAYAHIDLDAARERGITVCNIPDTNPADERDCARICTQVIDTIAAYLRGAAPNLAATAG